LGVDEYQRVSLQSLRHWNMQTLNMNQAERRISIWLVVCISITWQYYASPALAQSVCLPLPRLLTMMPMGGTIGSVTEVVITGENMDDVESLLFSDKRIKATAKLDANQQPVPNRFQVTIDQQCLEGIFEARTVSKLGVSSARIFSVSSLPEAIQIAPNTKLETAMKLPINSICNGVATAKSIDHYAFQAQQGHRYAIYCSARGIDSKLDPVVVLADQSGRDLVVERQGDVLEHIAQEDGPLIIKVHELTFRGGPAFFYRLVIQELSLESAMPRYPSTLAVNSFSWPPQGQSTTSSTIESEPNNLGREAQKISLPCDITGSFYPAADVDAFEFTAKKGEVWWVEVASDRLGRPTDPTVLIQHVGYDKGTESLTDVAELNDISSPMKPSSNGYAYDGPPFDGGSTDVLGKFECQQDGIHRLQVSDLFGGTRTDSRNIYRLIVRKAEPDFALVGWGMHMELRNGDRNALSKPLALRSGSTVAIEVVAFRRDGFLGEIQLAMDGLPDGVIAHGLKVPAGKSRGIILLTAHEDAPKSLAEASITGTAEIEGNRISHPVRMAQMAWPVPDSWGEIPSPRLVDGAFVSVTKAEYAPLSISQGERSWIEAVAGSKLKVRLVQNKRSEFSGSVLQLKALGDGFEQMPRFDVPLDSSEYVATIDLAALKTPPGEYVLAFYGGAVAKYRTKPDAPPQDTVEIVVTEPISIRVKPLEPK